MFLTVFNCSETRLGFSKPALLPPVPVVPALLGYESTAEISMLTFTHFPWRSRGQMPEQGSRGWGESIVEVKRKSKLTETETEETNTSYMTLQEKLLDVFPCDSYPWQRRILQSCDLSPLFHLCCQPRSRPSSLIPNLRFPSSLLRAS